ncbi:zinc finger protein ZXDC [Oryzias latipes]|uniref:Si:dkey-156n14.3 n=1 Tax=Oryzias latipes TaxID=8090 RepID=H2M0J6_ORYLA|nr:zinc finger protein ZXDC [Oryzias latipes]
MEMQGLSDALNLHSQHGAVHRATVTTLQTASGSISPFIFAENEADRLQLSCRPQSDNNNNSTRPKMLRLAAESGSDVFCWPVKKPAVGANSVNYRADLELHSIISEKEAELQTLLGTHEAAWKYEESADSAMQMALPLFEGEEEAMSPRQRLPGDARGDSEGGTDKTGQELFVVFNVVKEHGAAKHQLGESGSKSKCRNGGIKPDDGGSMEVALIDNVAFPECHDSLSCLDTERAFSVNEQTDTNKQVQDALLTNKYGDKVCGHLFPENSEADKELSQQHNSEEGIALVSEVVGVMEAMETSGFVPETGGLKASTNAVTFSTNTPNTETFTGTITVNNQSIIVTVENGLLTLTTPPNGQGLKDDGMVSLKEHLGMKEHEDIVLLNYDSGAKSIGKISTLAGSSTNQQEGHCSGLSVSDSELALVDDCSLPELSTSLDSCPLVKQETGALCVVTEAGLLSSSLKATMIKRHKDSHSVPLSRSKKDTVATFECPEPGCSCTFDSRQKLKVHLLNHAEDPRPYQCTVEGCKWAFATSYKLKRHLQSHDKQRPHMCQFEGCGKRFTTVYNLKAHVKVHEQDNAFICEICSERFRTSTRLNNHQRVHFEPQRPHKCEYPACEKTFITFSALFSHNRTHFKETGNFTCTYPGCDKTYDKACRLKIHMRSHTGERPFLCDSEGCGWSFTSMSKLLRHKRKHDDDRRFVCTEEGCGKSFTRAEHLKGHSITHLGTKPFQCHTEGCNAKFSARSSLYIHSKKHKQDASSLKTRCPVANCSKFFSARSSLKSHMLKHHQLRPDVFSHMETTPSLTPSSELVSSNLTPVAAPGAAGGDQLPSLDLSSLLSAVPGDPAPTAGIGVGIPVAGSSSNVPFTMDLSLVSSGILTIDPSSVGTTLVASSNTTMAKALDPLIMAPNADIVPHHGLEGTGDVLPPQGTLNLDDVQTVTPEALGSLTMHGSGVSVDPSMQHPLGSSSSLSVEPSSLAVAPVAELLASPPKVVEVGGQEGSGPLLGCVEVLGPQEGGKVLTHFVFPSQSSSFSQQRDLELSAVSPSSFLESGGSARTDYRAIQLAKKKKQRGSCATSGASGACQRKAKGSKVSSAPAPLTSSSGRCGDGAVTVSGGLTLRDPVTGAQYVQIQLLQDDPAADGDLAFQLSSQPSSSHSQLTVDLPVNILQEPSGMTEDHGGSDSSQFTGSTINLQDLE